MSPTLPLGLTSTVTLEDFLQQANLEESPAWEYQDGAVIQKPMPKFRHSLLQQRLLRALEDPQAQYLALPELRCTFGGRSIVPDVVMIRCDRVVLNDRGEPEDQFNQAPDWAIEILSPDQSSNRVLDNLLHCLHHGSQLGWLVDPDDYSIVVLTPPHAIQICRGEQILAVLPDLSLKITAQTVFQWLKLGA